jgi:predicted membrane metal-binding protein
MSDTTKRLIAALLCGVLLASLAGAQTITPVPEPYNKDSIPTWAHDIRRTEIITFGSLPFVALLMSIFATPLSSVLDTDRKKLYTALSISAALWIVDLTFQIINRRQLTQTGNITVTPLEKDTDAAPQGDASPTGSDSVGTAESP